jgi:hypothetical protein
MAGEDGNKEKEKDGKKEKEKEKVEEGIITAVYKVNLHCQQCARDIKKPLLTRTQGIYIYIYILMHSFLVMISFPLCLASKKMEEKEKLWDY